MINIRYHIITLVAVFLALAIGIVAGSTVVQQSLVKNLESNVANVESRLNDVDKRNSELNQQLSDLRSEQKAMAEQGPAQLLSNRLSGETIVMIGVDGIDNGSFGSLRRTLATAGAEVAGTVWLHQRVALTDDQSISDLAQILGVTTTSPAALHAELAQRLGDLLAVVTAPGPTGRPPVSTLPPLSDETAIAAATRLFNLLKDLQAARFIDLEDGLSRVDSSVLVGARLVFDGGTGAKLDANALLYPLLQRLGQNAQPVAIAVEGLTTSAKVARGDFVGALRSDRRLRTRLSTVDDAETFSGWAATVLALDDLDRGHVGHYGVGDGAERLLPAPPS